jgi:hypothetical protein
MANRHDLVIAARAGDGDAYEWQLWNMDPRYYESWDLLRAGTTAPPAGTQLVTVAGVRTLFARNGSNKVPINPTFVNGDASIPGADEVLTWQMVDRSHGNGGFQVTAAIRGPSVAELEAQVQAVIASLHYAVPIVPLPTDGHPDARRRRLRSFSPSGGPRAGATTMPS